MWYVSNMDAHPKVDKAREEWENARKAYAQSITDAYMERLVELHPDIQSVTLEVLDEHREDWFFRVVEARRSDGWRLDRDEIDELDDPDLYELTGLMHDVFPPFSYVDHVSSGFMATEPTRLELKANAHN